MMRFSLFFALALSFPALAQPPAKYAEAIRSLEGLIERERRDAGIPGLSIVLVEDQTVLWAKGFGHADLAKTRPTSTDTVYRVGSVSKLFTDIAVMQLVEEGKLDLDAPVTKYLPEFKPENLLGKPIALRQLMAHRSGLVREPSVGNYFDPDSPSLEKTVASLNGVPFVYEPWTKTKYSGYDPEVAGLEGDPYCSRFDSFSSVICHRTLRALSR